MTPRSGGRDRRHNIVDAQIRSTLLDREQEIESLADFLSSLTDSTRVDLQIAKIVDKDEVVPRGVEIADDIARLFEVLMPLYEASVV